MPRHSRACITGGVCHFARLPIEIRQQVYRELLCSFETWDECLRRDPSFFANRNTVPPPPKLRARVHPAVLRTCRWIYSEARDEMIRANRFMRLVIDSPFLKWLKFSRVPVVSARKHAIERFSARRDSCVLSYFLRGRQQLSETQGWYMILARHWDRFVQALADIDDREAVHIVELHNPFLGNPSYPNAQQQSDLLAPFVAHLFGLGPNQFTLLGRVSQAQHDLFMQTVHQPLVDPQRLLRTVTQKQKQGEQALASGFPHVARRQFEEIRKAIERQRSSPHWATLVQQQQQQGGGTMFLRRMVSTYCVANLSEADCHVSHWLDLRTATQSAVDHARFRVTRARNSWEAVLGPGVSQEEAAAVWVAPSAVLAKMHFLAAMNAIFLRLWDLARAEMDRALREEAGEELAERISEWDEFLRRFETGQWFST